MTYGNRGIVKRTNESSRNVKPRTCVESDAEVMSFDYDKSPLVRVVGPTRGDTMHTKGYVSLLKRGTSENSNDRGSIDNVNENDIVKFCSKSYSDSKNIDPHLMR